MEWSANVWLWDIAHIKKVASVLTRVLLASFGNVLFKDRQLSSRHECIWSTISVVSGRLRKWHAFARLHQKGCGLNSWHNIDITNSSPARPNDCSLVMAKQQARLPRYESIVVIKIEANLVMTYIRKNHQKSKYIQFTSIHIVSQREVSKACRGTAEKLLKLRCYAMERVLIDHSDCSCCIRRTDLKTCELCPKMYGSFSLTSETNHIICIVYIRLSH